MRIIFKFQISCYSEIDIRIGGLKLRANHCANYSKTRFLLLFSFYFFFFQSQPLFKISISFLFSHVFQSKRLFLQIMILCLNYVVLLCCFRKGKSKLLHSSTLAHAFTTHKHIYIKLRTQPYIFYCCLLFFFGLLRVFYFIDVPIYFERIGSFRMNNSIWRNTLHFLVAFLSLISVCDYRCLCIDVSLCVLFFRIL